MELIKVIALLCQVGSGESTGWVMDKQLECQKYYIECMEGKFKTKRLVACIKKKKETYR